MKFVEDHILSFSTAWNVAQSSQYDGGRWNVIIFIESNWNQGDIKNHRNVKKRTQKHNFHKTDNGVKMKHNITR